MNIIKLIIALLMEVIIYVIAKFLISDTFACGAIAGILMQALNSLIFKEN